MILYSVYFNKDNSKNSILYTFHANINYFMYILRISMLQLFQEHGLDLR